MPTVAILVRNTIVKITNPFLQCSYWNLFTGVFMSAIKRTE